MKLQGSLACLLLALYLGSGEAGPLLSGGASAETGIGEAIGQGVGEAASSGIREAMGPGMGDAFGHRVGEAIRQGVEAAAHAFGDTGSEAGRQTENIIRHGIDAAHSSWQGMPSNNGAWGTNGQPPSRGHGIFGSQGGLGSHSQGNPEGPGTPWGHGHSGSSDGNFGTNSQGSSWGQGGNGGPYDLGTNAQGAVAQPGYDSVRGNSNPNTECTNAPPSGSDASSSNSWEHDTSSSSGSSGGSGNKPGCDNPGNEVRVSGGSGGQGQGSSGGGEAVSGINNLNSQTSPGLFDFDTFWKNFKSKLGFINWDAINQGQLPSPSTRALLYFSRLWEDFKHNTPFLNWKAIIEGVNPSSSLQKRAGSAGQPGAGWPEVPAVTSKNYNYNQQAYPTPSSGQYSAKIPAKGGVMVSSSASRVQPGLLQWVKFW
ncbi:dermokine [Phyllostomus discolor]|uniref:Dermokine n=1 Tax=Phyllostomus discolor TaxID=89673 RepID=A0A833YQ73_9CHIR|nr:dermokine [Phyllostomus discolor]